MTFVKPAPSGSRRLGRVAALVVPLAVAVLIGGCSAGDDQGALQPDQPAPTTRHDAHREHPRTDAAHRPTPRRSTSAAPSTRPPASADDLDGAALSQWLWYDTLDVRVLRYRRDAVRASGPSRLDVITVEECAGSGSARPRHSAWHLVDAAGHTVGVAGAKLVRGQPTEDIPRALSPGECARTDLVVGLPEEASPVAVKDGPVATWLLPQ